ncbi:TetR/AcrR family transcriptional regulator [Rhodococcus sp. RS1C4]|uniref:TetR/AcrR family transcriptional regulator n=1 Tax=Nocardiaceae TaxID=85025 RepID=UPI000369905A|nr:MULTISPECIES: TetR/AcrR family transcriptional regulator [Rhodococcus]OZC55287.1 TetR/AcrR family transcriptional regulator [Rhodococcus sp. 06-621-2]OZC58394.1 TetR/AcrR family transcriptional regulator [Rhodococcus sp. RS1C4]OZC88227.1 TetR/AcrR family transcriptional regulator [Rhodococcus sp. 06-418-1B]OZE86164.1 TetR/AcrR family transcriptional regulator [Rhodococcus sp. 15-649-1-2]OZF56695.1 TetR/AcrR family transcriptional regulator [Rhodococcus sp. 14-2470-1a]
MPKVSEDHREERRRQIIDAAMTCFARSGFEKTSMADIIAESALSAGAIYSYFKNKQDLVLHVTRDVLKSRTEDLDGLEKQHPLPPPAVVVRLFLDGMTRDVGNPSILLQIWAAAARETDADSTVVPVVTELRGLYERYLRVWFTRNGFDDPDTRAQSMAPLVVGLCQGFILQSALLPDFDSEGYLKALDHLSL